MTSRVRQRPSKCCGCRSAWSLLSRAAFLAGSNKTPQEEKCCDCPSCKKSFKESLLLLLLEVCSKTGLLAFSTRKATCLGHWVSKPRNKPGVKARRWQLWPGSSNSMSLLQSRVCVVARAGWQWCGSQDVSEGEGEQGSVDPCIAWKGP